MASLKRSSMGLFVPLALGYALAAPAQPPKGTDNLDVTMTLLPESAKSPEPITRRIELPAAENPAGEKGQSGAQQGEQSSPPLDGPGQGRDTAAEARERGREFGQDVAEQARENRENAGRGHAPDVRPPGPPIDLPSPPNAPGPGKP
jgi:hypothetical protein